MTSAEANAEPPASERVLLLVAVNTDQPDIKRRMEMILAASQPIESVATAEVTAKNVSEFRTGDLAGLAAIFGWGSVRRLALVPDDALKS